MHRSAFALFLLLLASTAAFAAPPTTPDRETAQKSAPLGKPGDKVMLPSGGYFVWQFDKPPKMGNRVVKLEIFTPDGKKDSAYEAHGQLDMPSMRGAHASGEQLFRVSKNGDYLLPIHLAMPGEWELKITVLKNGIVLYRGLHLFKI